MESSCCSLSVGAVALSSIIYSSVQHVGETKNVGDCHLHTSFSRRDDVRGPLTNGSPPHIEWDTFDHRTEPLTRHGGIKSHVTPCPSDHGRRTLPDGYFLVHFP